MLRIAVGLLAVAAACPLIAFAGSERDAAAALVAVASVTVPATLLLGAPTAAVLVRRRWLAAWQAAAGGALVGALCVVPFAAGGPLLLLFLVPNFVGIGALHGLAFWWIALWRRGRPAAGLRLGTPRIGEP